jgi:hypothetical protein
MLSNNFNVYLTSLFTYIVDNYKQLILLILVFAIIFIVEYITNINAIIYGVTQIPGISSASLSSEHKTSHVNRKKRRIKK